MADPEGRSSVDLEDFKFISLLEYSADNRKVSRKKHLLNARQEQFFLPEGHCSCILWEKSPKESEEKHVGILFLGGARYNEPSTWELGNSLTLMEFILSSSDVEINSCNVFGPDKLRGSSLFPLQGSTLINARSKLPPDPEEYVLLLWGGIDTRTMTCTNELMKINVTAKDKQNKRTASGSKKMPESLNFEIDLTALTGNKTPSTEGSAFQMGTVPSPRTGHSFTTISSKRAILFGGVTLENRLEGVDNIFRQSCKNGRLYAFNLMENSWTCLPEEIPPRAYHAAVFRSATSTLYIAGGIQLADDHVVEYCSIHEVTAVEFNFATNTILSSSVQFPMVAPQYLSSQAATICDNIIHIFGGYQANARTISTKPNQSSCLFVLDVDKQVYLSKTAKPEHATAGHSMFLLDSSTFLICGGTKKEILLFTKTIPQADNCD